MKIIKHTYIFTIITCILSLSSCDFLDVVPDNVATEENVFSDRYTAEKDLATCYWGLPKSSGWNESPAMFGAMEMIFNSEAANGAGMRYGLGEDNATNALINYWSNKGDAVRSLYAGIRECNTFISGVVNVKDLETHEKNRMIDEVKVIKAYMHFYLLKYYGPICPLRESPAVNESTQGVRVYREKVDACFEYILSLLNEVIDNDAIPLILTNPTTELGRFALPAVHMLKAQVLTYWASPLFNGNTDYNSFVDQNNEPFFNQTYLPKRWTDAADACKKAVEVCESAGIRLYQATDYISSKKISEETLQIQTLRSVITQRWNPESIWSNTSYPAGSGLQAACFTYFEPATSLQAVNQAMSLPLSTVEQFYTKNGVPIDEDITYDYVNRYNIRVGDFEHRYYIQEGEKTAQLNFDREPRYYSTLGFDRGKWYGNSYKNMPDNDADALFPKNRAGEYSSVGNPGQYNATGYWPKKLVSINSTFRDANSVSWETYPFPDMRYADLLLLTAEVLNEVKDSPDEEVYKYIDMVRERAGLNEVVQSWNNFSSQPNKPKSKDGMRDIIHQERKVELACEGAYYWDTHRWKTAQKEQNRVIQGWNIAGSEAEDYYTVTTIYTQSFTYKNYFAPIPESEMVNNPQLVQNPGW